MITNHKLKIWTIITHALIVVGFGHGAIFFGFLAIFWFPYFTKAPFSFLLTAPFESRLPVAGLATLLGQVFLIYSILSKENKPKAIAHLVGIGLLWLSLLYFTYGMDEGPSVHFATLTAIPFLICTLIAFAGRPLGKFYKWIID